MSDINDMLGSARPAGAPGDDATLVTTSSVNRYRDAYRVAGTITAIGEAVKGLGLLLGIVAAVGFPSLLGSKAVTTGLFFGGVIAVFGFVLGVLVSAQGQLLKATLDSAVNGSPFLSPVERAKAMSLDVRAS